MRLVRLSQRNSEELGASHVIYRQLLPFYGSHSVAKSHFLQELITSNYQCVGLEDHGQLVALISYRSSLEKIEICNLLLVAGHVSKKRGLYFWLNWLEKLAKYERKSGLSLTLGVWDYLIAEKLQRTGYQQVVIAEGYGYFTKELTYKTGLVLAGGGARGAYQVGVWRALNELEVHYELICGTSVGALNGGLILQGDFSVAEKMWQEIDTGKILNYPGSQSEATFQCIRLLKKFKN